MDRKASSVELEEHSSRSTTSYGDDRTSSKILQILSWSLPRILAIIFLIVLLVWIFQAEGGLGFDEASVFGFHALFMALFIVIFTQESVLAFASPLISGPFIKSSSLVEKYFHFSCHVLGIICAMLGIVAIVYYKSLSPLPLAFPFYSVYSPHSWLGIALLILWGSQFVAGLYIHVIGNLGRDDKIFIVKIHKYLGKVIYVTGLATCALGLQDMQSSDLASSTPPMPGIYDTLSMGGQTVIVSGNMTINVTGYYPNSPEAQYSSACTILLLFLGMATFGTLLREDRTPNKVQ